MKGSSIDTVFFTIRCLVVISALVIEGLEAYKTLRLKRYTKVRTFLKCTLCIGFHMKRCLSVSSFNPFPLLELCKYMYSLIVLHWRKFKTLYFNQSRTK